MIDKKWLEFAEEDYQVLEYLWKSKSKFYRSICFHGQQYVEKILKGIIEYAGDTPPRIHDLNALNQKCQKSGVEIPLNETEILFLSSVYIDTRYPPDVGLLPKGEPLKSDAELAVKACKKLKKWISTLPGGEKDGKGDKDVGRTF